MDRKAAYAGLFYPDSDHKCLQMFRNFETQLTHAKYPNNNLCCGVVPHAGWVYSGRVAYAVFDAIKKSMIIPRTFVIFGAIHVPGVSKAAIWTKGKWETVFGNVVVDENLAEKIVQQFSGIDQNEKHHLREHSIEVLLPFIKYFFSESKIVPIMVPVDRNAVDLGKKIGELVGNDSFVICSTDLTHYGSRFGFSPKGFGRKALNWVKNENDKRIIDLMLQLKDNEIVNEVRTNQNACGGGAIAASLAFAKTRQKESGNLISYLTSWDIHQEENIDNFVGYAGVTI